MNEPSFQGNIQSYLKDRTLLFRYLVIINLIFGAWYLQWRITHSLNFAALWLSIPLLLAEIYSYLGGVMFLIGLWQPVVRKIRSFNCLVPKFLEAEYPTIDIFITCYNEPAEMVAETAKASLAIDYPVDKLKVYILDDGNSSDMRAMSESLCLQDLRSSLLQKQATRIEQERSQLVNRLQQLKNITPDIVASDEYLQTYKLQTKSDLGELVEVLDWFNSLKTDEIDVRSWLEFQTILGEAFDNVVGHAHQGLPENTPIDLEIAILSQSLVLKIWDYGVEFDLKSYKCQLPDVVEPEAESGRGILIMEELSDYFSYTRLDDGRNCLLVIKAYSPVYTENTAKSNCPLPIQGLGQLFSLLNPQDKQLQDCLSREQQALEQAIYQKELELSELSRCRYIARPKPKGKAHHAKAGNINHAIFSGETSGEFIVTLDADHIPKPEFLNRVLPYFYQYNLHTGKYQQNQIAFVQTPQAFYNLPPGDPFGHQAHLFYGPIQQGKDGMEAAFYTGTNAILRREALVSVGLQNFSDEYELDNNRLDEFDLVGGVSSNSITEDMNTAMRLHAAGWKSVYHHEELSVGLAPDDLSSTLKQRLRWAQGTIQVLLKENPWSKPGLTFWQRLQYFQTMYSYFAGFFIVIFIACPLIYFFTGIIPVRSFSADFAIHFLPAFILNRLTFIVATWGIPASEVWRSEQYAIALFPLMIRAVWSIFSGRDVKFQVTPKQRQSGRYLHLVTAQLLVFVLTILGIIYCIYLLVTSNLENPWTYFINFFWAIYNLSLLWVIIKAAVWQPKSN
ncbi:glycosyltransferase [Pleurocapsa sp. PCC 7319]|uniref:glycosyltransferase n=1 Tax=Pleurocapsa sp. PCC 7319 TaxID=118161 RepID=UPI00034B4FA4|nr:glycosyltransferase family 2 protein [Pleurocapsa sp. PCC 7319]